MTATAKDASVNGRAFAEQWNQQTHSVEAQAVRKFHQDLDQLKTQPPIQWVELKEATVALTNKHILPEFKVTGADSARSGDRYCRIVGTTANKNADEKDLVVALGRKDGNTSKAENVVILGRDGKFYQAQKVDGGYIRTGDAIANNGKELEELDKKGQIDAPAKQPVNGQDPLAAPSAVDDPNSPDALQEWLLKKGDSGKSVFEQIDTSGNGLLTHEEIEHYLTKPNLKDEQRYFLNNLIRDRDLITTLSDDGNSYEISSNDIYKMGQLRQSAEWMFKPLGPSGLTPFQQIDHNEDGYLDEHEIRRFKTNHPEISQNEKGYLNFLDESYSKVGNLSNDENGFENDGITEHDLRKI